MPNNRILHISSHLGGGVGKALSGLFEYEKKTNSNLTHKVLLLEKPENKHFIDICTQQNIDVELLTNQLESEIETSDVIIIHWWHHPLMAKLLTNFPKTPARIIFWSHVNGCTYPHLTFDLINSFEKIFFTSRFSLENPSWNNEEKEIIRKKTAIVYGLGNLDLPASYIKKQRNSYEFTIGYAGTLNFSKLHPDFVKFCNKVIALIPCVKFILVGDYSSKTEIEKQVQQLNIQDKFEFVDYTQDIYSQFSRFDIFAYPLNPYHFGTTENVILEAMRASVPVVLLNQNTEKYLITHNQTGFLANNQEHYAKIIEDLYKNPKIGVSIAQNALQYLQAEFSMTKNANHFRQNIYEVLEMQKKEYEFKTVLGDTPHKWFLSCLGNDRIIFEKSLTDKNEQTKLKIKNCKEILKGKSKSSINHFLKYFHEDEILQYWSNIIEKRSAENE